MISTPGSRCRPVFSASRPGTAVAQTGMLSLSLSLLVGTWVLALVRLARTWRDTPAVPLIESRPIHRLAA